MWLLSLALTFLLNWRQKDHLYNCHFENVGQHKYFQDALKRGIFDVLFSKISIHYSSNNPKNHLNNKFH